MFDLTIKKYKKSRGIFFHKIPRVGAKKAQRIASKDISEECAKSDGLYTKNYLAIEYELIKLTSMGFRLDSLDEVRQMVPNLF